MTLTAGRQLRYLDHAPEKEKTMIFFHGVPSDHSPVLALPGFPFLRDFRIIAFDRPGYGESDPDHRSGYSRLAGDVEELTSHLGIKKFYVEGVSGGGPWALAVANAMPGQVNGAILVSPMGPVTTEVLADVNAVNRRVYQVTRKAPFLMRLNVAGLAFVLRHFPEWYLERMKAKLSPVDVQAMSTPEVRRILRVTFQNSAKRTSYGLFQDVLNQALPWDFEVSSVPCPVVIYQCNEDHSTPRSVGQYFEKTLKRVKLHYIENAGHLWHLLHMTEVLEQGIREIEEMS